jgi:ATP-dependent helicase/nuclease subunit B
MIFAGLSPRWFTIPAHRPFLEDLAATLYAVLSADGPESLADAVVLTPTRRGARSLGEAFLKATGGKALLLPQILALGDLDEGEPPFEPGDLTLDLPPAITPSQRRFELARLVSDHAPLFQRSLDAAAALELGDALGGFLDSVQIEELDPSGKLDSLVDDDMAAHWKTSADVLRLATDLWPARLRELGLLDVNQRRTALLRALAEQWSASPPRRPLIAAGSTGTDPATADLLAVIASAPKGCVVLPGLDGNLAYDAWEQITGQPGEAHPQGAMKRLLDRVGVHRDAVQLWPNGESQTSARTGKARQRVINEALRPPDATADWLRIIETLRVQGGGEADPIAQGLAGLSLATAGNEEEAATLAAVLLRETLERPGETAALITPDQAMARRVSARLARWGVEVDSSAGRPLPDYPAGVLIALVSRAAAGGLDPATLLAILKHPLVRLGVDAATLDAGRRSLERYGLRGPRPRDWAGVHKRLTDARDRPPREGDAHSPERARGFDAGLTLARALEQALAIAAAPLRAGDATLSDAARALGAALESLARDETDALGALWSGAGGEAAAGFIASLIEDGAPIGGLDAPGAAAVIEALLAQTPVRTGGANHPRLRILGALEARLVRADRLILAGLEEGVWPQSPPVDPFLSRPMRAKLGLPPPERRIGLSAHDFAQAACAPEVILISTERRGGQPAVKSRWLWRLETLAKGAGLTLPRRRDVEAWADALDAPLDPRPQTLEPAKRPEPRPPLEARPRKMPVTRVETWVRDPYAVYARDILGLRLLDRPDAEMAASRRGTAIHKAFEQFALAHAGGPPAHADALFARLVIEALQAEGFPEAALTRERTLAARLGGWAAAFELERRATLQTLAVEREGALGFTVEGRPFTLTAKADRIELSAGELGLLAHVLDFKTGAAPTPEQVKAGFYPQLTLTAAILARGGFEDLGLPAPGELLYVRAIGRRVAGEVKSAVKKGHTALELAEAAMEGLARRIARFDDPDTPYLAWTAPQFLAQRGGDFDHLSRLYEWHVMGETGDGEAGE